MKTAPTYETVRAALDAIPPDSCGHDERARLAFAVFDGLGDAGADLWLEWAAGRSKPDAAEDRSTWKSCRKRGRVTVATLFGLAKDHGFRFEAVQTTAPRPTPAELKARAAARRAADEREERERGERQREAAAEAARLWASGADVTDPAEAPYLVRKGAHPFGVRRLPDGALLVPMHDGSGELVNVQTIRPERPADGGPEKLFLKGGRKTGAYHLIGAADGAPWLLVAEGYATAASCHEATGRPVAVAFDAGNLAHVVRVLRGRWPDARLLIAGDDDRATADRTGKNPGRDKASAAARLAHGVAVFPAFPAEAAAAASDFNDLHQCAGLDAVRDRLESAIAAAEREPAGKPTGSADKRRRTTDAGDPEQAQPAGRQRPARCAADEAETGAAPRDRFELDEFGVWYTPPGDDATRRKVCPPLHVSAIGRDANDTGAALLLEFDAFGKPRRWLMPLAMLAGDGAEYRRELLNQGFSVPTGSDPRRWLTAYLASRQPAELVRIVDRVGWHGRAFVLPGETLGDDGGERIIFQSETPTEARFGRRGTLEQWQALIGRPCVGNSRLVFAVCCAFAGPLLAWAGGADGGGVHLVGDSSCGKTTGLRLAASVWGGRDYLQRWRATDNGLEALAAQHSDSLLLLDELAQLDAKVAGEAAYMLANGQGKSRAGRTGAARPRATWRLLFLSAGEVGLADHMAEANKRTRAGQELRMIDLRADAGAGLGIFENLHGTEGGGSAFAQHLTRAAETTFGAAGRAWLEYLTDHTEGLGRTLRERMDAFERDAVPEAAAGQVQRVGRRFALVAAAGELATAAGITGWPEGAATAAARRCFDDWIAARPGGVGLTEDARALRQAVQWFALHGDSRFKPWWRTDSDNKPNTPLMAGWRKEIEGDERNSSGEQVRMATAREWFVITRVFRDEACKGYRPDRLLQLLKDRGHLVTEGERGRMSCNVKVPGYGGAMVYRVKSSILSEDDDSD